MLRNSFVLAALLSFILPAVGRAQESDCVAARDGAYALLGANKISDPTINAIANDVLAMRLNALSEAQNQLAALGAEPQNDFFSTWSKSFSEVHQEWVESRNHLQAVVTNSCQLLMNRVADINALNSQ